MKAYLTKLITEKGKDMEDTIDLDGHYGLTYQMLVDFIAQMPEHHAGIKATLVKIDFANGDVFHFFNHLAAGMVAATEA